MKKLYILSKGRAIIFFNSLVFLLMLWGEGAMGQTIVTVGGGSSITCPATPTATWTTPPAGVTFSNWSRGSGVTCSSFSNALNGSGFNTASASASYSSNIYYSVTISADATHSFTLNEISWKTQLSGTSNSCNFTVQYKNNGGALTTFGAAGQAITSSGALTTLIFSGSVSVAAGTSLDVYLIPYSATATGTTVRWINGSTITVTGTTNTNPLDYFRSNGTGGGTWNNYSTWESSTDNSTWLPSDISPDYTAKTITIRSGDIVTLSSALTIDEVVIKNGAILDYSAVGSLTINDGTGNDIIAESGGIFRHSLTGGLLPVFNGSATMEVQGGGIVDVKTTAGAPSNYANTSGPGLGATKVLWNHGSIFNWDNNGAFATSSAVYFPNTNPLVVPIFRVSTSPGTVGATAPTVINGVLEVNSNFSLESAGTKTFRNGITGSATLTQISTSGNFIINGSNAILGGISLNLVLTSQLNLLSSVTVPAGKIVTISGANVDNNLAGNVFTVNGTIDVTNIAFSNLNGSIIINGLYRTAHGGGFSGSGSSIPSGSVALNAGSTVELYLLGNQALVSRPDFKNLILSGSGTKTPSSGFDPVGTITIKDAAIFDCSGFNVGNASTNLTMSGTSRLIVTTGSTQPQMAGLYSITGGTVEFAGTTSKTIRSETYQNIEVSGTDVGNSSGNITLNNLGTFTVKSGGLFHILAYSIVGPSGIQTVTVKNGGLFQTGNIQGFHGWPITYVPTISSSINNDIENIVLETGSTVEYYRAGDQPITALPFLDYHHLALTGSGVKTSPIGTLTISGNLTKGGTSTFSHNGGVVDLAGANQTFAGLTYNQLLFNGTGTKTTSGSSRIDEYLKINSGLTFAGTDTITISSTAAKTANVGMVLGSIVYNSGKFVVERFIKTPRKWQLLSVPTVSTQTVKTAWMENKTNIPGYGTFVTDSVSDYVSRGFDDFSVGGPSVKALDITTNIWKGINDINTPLTGSSAYLVFVRGDRQAASPAVASSTTTLRTTGQILKDDQVRNLPQAGFAMVGNPYASSVDIYKVDKTGLAGNELYYWDPSVGGSYNVGAYQTLTPNALGEYVFVPGGSAYYSGTTNRLESGQAFFVRTTAGGAITFKESDKLFGSRTVTLVGTLQHTLRANLFLNTFPSNRKLADGNMAFFDDAYSNSIDFYDAIKLTNSGENVSFKREDKLLAVERRQPITGRDTLFLNISRLAASAYQWEIPIVNLEAPGRKGYLVDNYLHQNTELHLSGNNVMDFVVDANAASAAADRFMIVFSNTAPVADPNIILTASRQQNQSVLVSWSTLHEAQLTRYEVERSSNGSGFSSLATLPALHASQPAYDFTDSDRQPFDSYYRIKGVGQNGLIVYSNVFKVLGFRHSNLVSISPNPAIGKIIYLETGHLPGGKYVVSFTGNGGQVLLNTEINVSGKSSVVPINIQGLRAGTYMVTIKDEGNFNKTLKLFVQ